MTYSNYDKPVPNTSKEGNQDADFTVIVEKQEHGSHPGKKSLPDVIQEKMEHGKNTIQQMAHNLRDGIKEPFEDRNEVEQAGKNLVDKTKEQGSRAKRELNGIFKDSDPTTGTTTNNNNKSYQEMLQDKIDQGTGAIKDMTHKVRDEIMETLRDGSDTNDSPMKQAGEDLRDKTKEQTSKVRDSWNEMIHDSGVNDTNMINNNGTFGVDEGFKSFGQEAKEEYQMDQKQAEEAKTEWGNTLELVKESVKDAMGNFHPNDHFDRDIDGNFSEYDGVLRESAGGAILPPFDPTNEPYTGDNALSSEKFQK